MATPTEVDKSAPVGSRTDGPSCRRRDWPTAAWLVAVELGRRGGSVRDRPSFVDEVSDHLGARFWWPGNRATVGVGSAAGVDRG